MRISCPHCGIRDHDEFTFGGTSHISRPSFDCSDEEWSQYLYFRDNPKGLHYERWQHAYGCGRWFNVARDTQTHVILAVYPMGDAAPPIESASSS
jgi:sarcosine oxidase subunit delta